MPQSVSRVGKRKANLEANWRKRPVISSKMELHLVVITIPRSATAANREEFVRSGYWLANYSLSFGKAQWDCIVVHPSVADPAPSQNDNLIRQLIHNHDLHLIDRCQGDTRGAGRS